MSSANIHFHEEDIAVSIDDYGVGVSSPPTRVFLTVTDKNFKTAIYFHGLTVKTLTNIWRTLGNKLMEMANPPKNHTLERMERDEATMPSEVPSIA